MTPANRERLLGFWQAFDSPFVAGATAALGALLVAVYLGIRLAYSTKRIDQETYSLAATRWRSWVGLAVGMLLPILLGGLWVMLSVMLLSLLCFREYARATGLFREKSICAIVVLGVVLVALANVDKWDRLFFASAAFTCGLIAVVTLPQDRPKGYVQRVALGVLGFVLLGHSFGYLGYAANDAHYRPLLVLILLAVAANDVAAYCVNKLVGGPILLTATSPGKTVAGSLAGLATTIGLVATLGPLALPESPVCRVDRLLILGLLIGTLGQLGRLVLSSIKRDVAIKDTGTALPGHGGLLDRFDSLVLVPPAVFHYISLIQGPLGGPAERLLTGSP